MVDVRAALSVLAAVSVIALGSTAPAAAQDPVTESREYKLMLNPTLFSGNAAAAAANYWDALENLIENGSIQRPTTGNLDSVTTTRTVRFYDTAGTCVLNGNGYSFRERVESGDREVTLKFRSPDRSSTTSTMMGRSCVIDQRCSSRMEPSARIP